MNGRETHLPPLHPVRADDAAHGPAATGSKEESLRTHRKKDEVWQVYMHKREFQLWILYLWQWQRVIMQNTMSSPASSALPGDCISYSPTLSPLQKKGRAAGWKMRSLGSNSSRRSQGRDALVTGKFCCARYLHAATKPKSCDPCAREVTQLHLETLKQNLSVQFSEERSTYELWVKLLAAQSQPNSAVIQARRWNSHVLPGAESEATHPPQSFPSCPQVYISHIVFSWQALFRLPQLNSYSSGWFNTITCFLSEQMWETL